VRELQRRGTLSDDFDPEKDLEELKNEDVIQLGFTTDGKPIDPLAEDAPAPAKKEPAPAAKT
jgi:hypothetical protein